MRIKFGIGTGRNQPIAQIKGHAKRAEELGFDHITFLDSQNLSRDVYVMMTIAAMETSRIHIGHGVTNPYTRHWTVTANATASLYELSGGRAFLGIGPGMSSVGTLGLKPRTIKELRQSIQWMRDMMAGKDVEVGENVVRSEWSRNKVPIYVGSDGPKSMQMAGAIAQGCIVPCIDPRVVQWRIENIQRGAEQAGRDPSEVDIWTRTMCFISDSKEKAREQARSYAATGATQFYFSVLQYDTPEAAELRKRVDPELLEDIKRVHDAYKYYEHERQEASHGQVVTDRVLDAFILNGSADDVVEQVSRVAEQGIRTISMTDYTQTDKIGMMENFSRQIMPYFRN